MLALWLVREHEIDREPAEAAEPLARRGDPGRKGLPEGAKLDVRNRAAAIVFAYDHGVVSPGATPPPNST